MTSRERVESALSFSGPDRIPMGLPSPYPNDFSRSGISPDPNRKSHGWEKKDGNWEMLDEWGNTWARLEDISKGEVAKGAIETWEMLESYEFPNYDLDMRYEKARKVFSSEKEKYRIGGIPGFPFNIARKMRRMDNFLMDLILEPDNVKGLLGKLEDILETAIIHLADAGADAVMFAEDWGAQDRLLIDPKLWRRFFKPGFERLCGVAHERGLAVFMHTCGHVYEIIGDLTEVGIDVLQFDQPELHGIDNLSRDFGGKANFWCPVDIQKTLQTKDEEKIRNAAREMIGKLGCFGGGFIAGYYGSNEAIGLDPIWQDIACRAFVDLGRYSSSS